MVENEKGGSILGIITEGLKQAFSIISASIFPSLADGAEMILKKIDDRICLIEKRILRKIFSLVVIGLGSLLLVFALFFFLKEYLGWNNSSAFFSIGIAVFVIGLLLKIAGSER